MSVFRRRSLADRGARSEEMRGERREEGGGRREERGEERRGEERREKRSECATLSSLFSLLSPASAFRFRGR
jgi:hypothetical protein